MTRSGIRWPRTLKPSLRAGYRRTPFTGTPTWYIVAKNDRTVHPELERFVAKRMGATTYEVDSSHVPMLSNPKLVIDVIRTAAKAVQGATVGAV